MKVNKIYEITDVIELTGIEESVFWECFVRANEISNSTQEFSRRFSLLLGDKFLTLSGEKFQKKFRTPHPDYERTDDLCPTFSSFENFMIHRATYNTFRHNCAKYFKVGIHNIECLEDLRGNKTYRKIQERKNKFEKITNNA